LDTFVSACVALRGAASSVEVHNLDCDFKALSKVVREEVPKMRVSMDELTRSVDPRISRVDSSMLDGAPPAAESISRDINSIANVMLKVACDPGFNEEAAA